MKLTLNRLPRSTYAAVWAPLFATVIAACTGADSPTQTAIKPSETQTQTLSNQAIPLDGLTETQMELFRRGEELFSRIFTPKTGLGPVFNGQSCAECHSSPTPGGTSDSQGSMVTRFTTPLTPHFSVGLAAQALGAPHIHSRSVADEFPEEVPGCNLAAETLPDLTVASTQRVTPHLFGIGLMEAITDASILANGFRATQANPNITGRPGALVPGGINDLSATDQLIGRIGARGFVGDVTSFTYGALHTEMGMHTPHPVFAVPVLPQGTPAPSECVPHPEMALSVDEVNAMVAFQRWLAPPPKPQLSEAGLRGEQLFSDIGCASCHTPTLMTSANAPSPLNNKLVHLYSDLLLHDLGDELADNAPEGLGLPTEWKTTPLWGVGQFNKPLMHDGRAGRDFAEAIRLHAGEAEAVTARYQLLSKEEQAELMAFLESL